ncbi:MAG: universal stress protein [Planctomycetaceae bacterium]
MKSNLRAIVALSATDADENLIRYARQVAKIGFCRHFYFVHVRSAAQVARDGRAGEEIREVCEAKIAELFGEPPQGVTYDCRVLTGERVDALIDFILHNRCDLAFLGHRKHRSGQRSLARRLAMISPCSVWMVPEGAPVSISGIIAPVDFSENSGDSLETAASIAHATGLRSVLATHIFFDPSTVRYDEHVEEILALEKHTFEEFVAKRDLKGVDVDLSMVEGNNVARSILHTASRHTCDLIVMNTRGRSRAAAILLGSTTTQVMIESPVAVLAVKHFGAMMNLFQALEESQFWRRRSPKTN